MTLRLLSYNIRFGGRGREERLAEVIRSADPDIVVFQEATSPDVVVRLAEATGLRRWGARPLHSLAFITRLDIGAHEWYRPLGAKHPFLEIVLAGSDARIFGLHLSAMFSKWSERRRKREILGLLAGIQQHQHGFHVLVGDFNTLAPGERLNVGRLPAWIRAMVWISGRDLQRETIQTMLDAGYADAFRALHAEDGGFTFPTWDPHLRLDYLFLPMRYREHVARIAVLEETEARGASDHFPLLAELKL